MAAFMMHPMHGTINLSEGRRFGVCDFATSSFARLIPKSMLFRGAWIRVESPEKSYPPDGKVFYPGIEMMNAEKGSFWEFSVRPNEKLEHNGDQGDRRHDEVIACDVARPNQAVDLSFFSIEEARQLIVEHGFSEKLNQDQPLFVKLADDLWACLPIEMIAGRWKPAKRFDLEKVALHRAVAPPAILEYEGLTFVSSSFRLGLVVREVDLTTDEMFAKALPRRLRQILGDTSPVGPEGFPEIINGHDAGLYVRASELLPHQQPRLQAFCDRLRSFSLSTRKNFDLIGELFRTIRDQPAVSRMIEDEAARIAGSMRDAIRIEVEAEISETWELNHAKLVADRERLESELTALEARNKAAIGRLSETKKKSEAIERGITEVVDGLRAILERAPKKSSERARLIGRHVEKVLGIGEENTLIPAELPPWSSSVPAEVTDIGPEELKEALSRGARAFAVDAVALERFDALLRAGQLPLLTGSDRDIFVQAYASVATGGSLRRMPLDPGIMGLDDLWRQPGTGQPTAFAHAWVSARAQPQTPILLSFDEIQATSGWAWIAPLADYLGGHDRPRNLLVCMTARRVPHERAEEFGRAVIELPRDAPSLPKEGSVASVNRRLGIDEPALTRLKCEAVSQTADRNEIGKLIAAFAGSLDSVRTVERAAAIFDASRLTMPYDDAVGLASEFAAFARGPAGHECSFSLAAAKFDEACGIVSATSR